MFIRKIVSGGQTGADRAALDVAIRCGIEHGGFVPRGRRAEDGVLDPMYLVTELKSSRYQDRTKRNVLASDGTLIFSHGELTGGSLLTFNLAKRLHKPVLHLDLLRYSDIGAADSMRRFLTGNNLETVNIAGPRASGDPLIYGAVTAILTVVFSLD